MIITNAYTRVRYRELALTGFRAISFFSLRSKNRRNGLRLRGRTLPLASLRWGPNPTFLSEKNLSFSFCWGGETKPPPLPAVARECCFATSPESTLALRGATGRASPPEVPPVRGVHHVGTRRESYAPQRFSNQSGGFITLVLSPKNSLEDARPVLRLRLPTIFQEGPNAPPFR